jgi:hypothetical protein
MVFEELSRKHMSKRKKHKKNKGKNDVKLISEEDQQLLRFSLCHCADAEREAADFALESVRTGWLQSSHAAFGTAKPGRKFLN